MKFGRTYNLVVKGREKTWNITFPRTLKFKVLNTGTFSANAGRFMVYNLPAEARHDIFHDPFEPPQYQQLVFAAGYEKEPRLPIVFQGNVYMAYSYREGPDWITEIEAYDGGFAIDTSQVNMVAPSGYKYQQILQLIALSLNKVTPGVISSKITVPNARGISITGNSWDQLIRRVLPFNAQAFISKEVVNVITQNEYLPNAGGFDVLSSDTGLIGSPRRQNNQIVVAMVFEPRLEVAQKLTLKSQEPANNGDYKVMALEHSGTISGALCGDLVTAATFYYGSEALEVAA